ncbi:hypothetical protein PVL29_015965 [Vitis rotundifolia]|uniref:Retrotransposon Copia-like N-terminal domain-containing protein n=1 Tax=Vitis rotundifolia TaxID=103349 RepID=A0AA38ZDZ6_VITRO|nr:hypothetical protein PVL29_015965 [Vitis rotundifolia]
MLDPWDSKYAAWRQSNCAVKTWILNSLELEINVSVGLASTAKEMWDAIKEMFSNDGNNSHIFSLFQQFVDNKQGERSLPEFFAAYNINEFHELLPLSTDLETQKHQWENLFVCGFLMNLNEQYYTLRSQLLGDSTTPMLQSAFSHLQFASLTLSSPGVDLEHSAMAARGRVRDTGKSKNCDSLCEFCGKRGHTMDQCWDKHSKPDWATKGAKLSNIPKAAAVIVASNGSTSSSAVPQDVIQISKEEYDRLLHSQPSSIASHALQSGTGTLAAFSRNSWLIDSGASNHDW